jgi:Flp pilus assembly protein TadG
LLPSPRDGQRSARIQKEGKPVLLVPLQAKDARRRRAAATAELAVCLPFMIFVLMVGIDYCRIFYYTITMENAARAGALYASYSTVNAQDTTGITNAALADSTNLKSATVKVTQGTDANGNATVNVTVNQTFKTISNYPVLPSSVNLNRTVSMRVLPN